MAEKDSSADKKDPVADLSAMLGMGGLLEGMSGLISKFGELAERGESLHKTLGGQTPGGKPFQSSVGFSVKFAGEGRDASSPQVAPVNPASPAKATARATNAPGPAQKMREPNVDLFEEEDHVLLVAEMPGVPSEAIELNFQDQMLLIEGSSPSAVFRKQVELPRAYTREQVSITSHNGVVEIRLKNS